MDHTETVGATVEDVAQEGGEVCEDCATPQERWRMEHAALSLVKSYVDKAREIFSHAEFHSYDVPSVDSPITGDSFYENVPYHLEEILEGVEAQLAELNRRISNREQTK